MELKAIIPHMTNNNTPSPFVASTSNQLATYAPFYAFQDNGSAWISDVANSWIQIDLGRLYEVKKVYMDSVNAWTYARVRTFTLQGSTDGVHWTTLYSGSTKSYSYTEERDFGVMRYVRCTTHSMTMRGGAIRYLQLFTEADSFLNFNLDDIWVAHQPIVLKGDIIVANGPADVRVLINDVVVDDWLTYTHSSYSEYSYDPSLFKQGGNVITAQVRNAKGEIRDYQFVTYKLNLEAIKFSSMSYEFKIKNSPHHAKSDSWIGQSFPFDYLNSESGVSYMFKYKPYAQMDGRIEDRPRFFDKVLPKDAHIVQQVLTGAKVNTNGGIKLEDTLADISKVRDALKSRGFDLAIQEARIMHRVFETWGTVNIERIGIHDNDVDLAIKKMKIADDVISKHRLPASRKNAMKNALTFLQGFEFASKTLFGTVMDYYKAMDDFYPYKESLIAGVLLHGAKDFVKTGLTLEAMLVDIKESYGYKLEHDRVTVKPENLTVVGELINSERINEVQGGIIPDVSLGTPVSYYDAIIYDVVPRGETEDVEGFIDNLLYASKDETKEATTIRNEPKAIKNKGGEFLVITPMLIDKNIVSKEIFVDDIIWFETSGYDAYVETLRSYVENMAAGATIKTNPEFIEIMPIDALIDKQSTYIDNVAKEVRMMHEDTGYFNKQGKDIRNYDDDIIKVDKLLKDAWETYVENRFVEKAAKDFMLDESGMSIVHTEKQTSESKEGLPIFIHHYFETMGRDVRPTFIDTFVDKLEKQGEDANAGISFIEKLSREIFNEDDLLKSVDKIRKEAFLILILDNFNSLEKAVIIKENWEFAERVIPRALDMGDAARTAVKEGRDVYNPELSLAEREAFDTIVMEQLLMDYTSLDAYIEDLVGAELEMVRDNNREGFKQEIILTDREVARAIIQEAINAHRINHEKDAYVPENTFVLVGDGSAWEDIWNKYSPGVDILDPPDADYDYSKLAPAIYDPATGVPHRPIGASNKPNVYVNAAMHHPLPENSTFGVDDTKRIAVDNYIFIDTVLALESIKNRNTLRYAGMPVGKTIKEVFSSLFTWIQQGAPGHKEYERMFRFARWYAEAVVTRQSKTILHRIYNPWKSTLHMGTGLGVDHVKHGWMYMTGTGTLNTTTLSAKLTFSKENYIDSEFVLRGYFDNPTGQGTMEIVVDGTVVDSFNTHGVYERKVAIPQGYHTYDINFMGTSGSAAISSIEVGGTIFVSAHTSTDDSDVNGLKALNELMAQLLGYFDLHHGGGKIKGTMEVRQRAVWNTHT